MARKRPDLKALLPDLKALDTVQAVIEKAYGRGACMRLGSTDVQAVPVIPTISLRLNRALGIGGLPRGRIVETYGPESSGKTTLCLHAIAEAQKLGLAAAFVDAEHALDLQYAQALGVQTEHMLVSQPSCGEEALDIVDKLVRSGAVGIIVVDSVAALTPRAELEGEMGDATMGAHARLMSQACRKLTALVATSNTLLIFVNQIRHAIGVRFGSPERTTGGNALKFYASVRLDIRRIGAIKRGEEIVGNRTRIKVVKNKLAPPFREAEVDIRYGLGIDGIAELLDEACDTNVVVKSGSWFSFQGERLAQGRENVLARMRGEEKLRDEIKTAFLRGSSSQDPDDREEELA